MLATPRVPPVAPLLPNNTHTIFVSENNVPHEYKGINPVETNELFRKNWSAIKTFAMIRRFTKIYNIRIANNNITETLRQNNITTIFEDQKTKFKINASLGCILINNTERQLRYFHASANKDRLFDQPVLIENLQDYKNFIDKMLDKDFIENATRNRPDTAWCIHCLTNISFYIFPIPNHPIGCPGDIPDYVKNSKSIISLTTDSNGTTYKDNLCLFRAVSLAKNSHKTLESFTQQYFEQYLSSTGKTKEQFSGICLDDLPVIEQIFNLSVHVYTLSLVDGDPQAQLIYRSTSNHKSKLNLHLEGNHYCYIKNIRLYTKSYKCSYCSKLLRSAYSLRQHMLTCTSSSIYTYPSGPCGVGKTLFEKLDDEGIYVDESRRHYPYFAVWDCEAYFCRDNLPKDTKTIHWEAEHRLASVSIASNIAGFKEPICFVNDNGCEQEVVDQMLQYLEMLSELCYERLKVRYRSVFTEIDKKRELMVNNEMNAMDGKGVPRVESRFDRLEEELNDYLSNMLVFGFNSSSYDIPLIRNHLMNYFVANDREISFIIKKANSYIAIKTESLQFLDVCSYLAPGFSYSQYLKAMEVDAKKFFWIYDSFTSLDVLKQTSFPKREDFFSNLKQASISEEDYEYCKSVWKKENMKTVRDLLVYYNNADCKGFVMALEKQNEFFRSKNLDFKMAISMPGLAVRRLFQLKDCDAPILLFGEKNKDIYHLVKSQIRGGLSIIFSRYQHSGKTKIKQEYFGCEAKSTKKCYGVDVSGMYLSNLMKPMPTGAFVRRRAENSFCLEKSYSHGEIATQWIKYMETKLNVKFKHMFNGAEKRIGGRNLPVDGYAKTKCDEIVLQFSGCYYHSHLCSYSPNGRHGEQCKDLANQLETYKNLQYIQDLGYTLYHIWECEFMNMKKLDSDVRDFCSTVQTVVDKRPKLSEKQIIDEVKSGALFGMVQCDITTPDELKTIFSEFQPIAKHAYLSRHSIGEHMKSFAVANGLLKSPTKTLLNSYFGEKMLFATPLLKWYLNHGLKITKVYQVIQYHPSPCFQEFGKEVMDARRLGDVDASKKIIADSCKLMGE